MGGGGRRPGHLGPPSGYASGKTQATTKPFMSRKDYYDDADMKAPSSCSSITSLVCLLKLVFEITGKKIISINIYNTLNTCRVCIYMYNNVNDVFVFM